jgi:hypothetical protein
VSFHVDTKRIFPSCGCSSIQMFTVHILSKMTQSYWLPSPGPSLLLSPTMNLEISRTWIPALETLRLYQSPSWHTGTSSTLSNCTSAQQNTLTWPCPFSHSSLSSHLAMCTKMYPKAKFSLSPFPFLLLKQHCKNLYSVYYLFHFMSFLSSRPTVPSFNYPC